MSDSAEASDVVEVADDGVVVTKTYTADEFPVPAIRFEFESEHEGSVDVRVAEDIPESFPMDSVGFHPEYHSDQWTAFQDNHVEFTGTVDPDETLVTVYGVRLEDDTEPDMFLSEPTVTVLTEDGDDGSEAEATDDELEETMIDDIAGEDGNQAVKDMLSGATDSVPGLEEDTPREADTEAGEGGTAETGEADLNLEFDEDEVDDGAVTEADDGDDATSAEVPADSSADEADANDPVLDADEELDLDLGDVDTEPTPVDEESEADDDAPDIDLGFEEDELPEPEAAETDESETASADAETDETDETDAPKIELDLEAAAESTDVGGDDGEHAESGSETDDDPDAEVDAEPADVKAPDEVDTDTPESPASPGEVTVADGSIVEALAGEIRSGDVDEASLTTLRSALESEEDAEGDAPVIARVDHLQSRVEEIAAYTGALEEFLMESGTGAQVIESVEGGLEAVETELDDVVERLEATESGLEATDDRFATLEETTESLEDDVEAVDEQVSAVETELEGVTEDLAGVTEDVETTTDDLDERVEDVAETVGSIDDDVQSVAGDVEALEDDVETLENDLTSVREDVVDIVEWRDELGSMFSG